MDYVEMLKGILARVEEVRSPLCEKADILRNTILRESHNEWLKGESPRCKREHAMSCDESNLRHVRDAIEVLADNTHLLQELENAGWDYENFYKKYDHE